MVVNVNEVRYFEHDGLKLAFRDEGQGEPILLIHGFASSGMFNWLNPGWFKTLLEAGYRVIAIDNRGHGRSDKPHDRERYYPSMMAADAVALLDHLNISKAHIMGYSMGARISAFIALNDPQRVQSLVFGGLGIGMVTGAGDWDPIHDALLAEDVDSISNARGLMFRKFADQTKSDRVALAACVITSKELITAQSMAQITQPVLVAVGTKDDIAGDAQQLADLMLDARAFEIAGRDHMLAVGDKTYKAAVLEFVQQHRMS